MKNNMLSMMYVEFEKMYHGDYKLFKEAFNATPLSNMGFKNKFEEFCALKYNYSGKEPELINLGFDNLIKNADGEGYDDIVKFLKKEQKYYK